MTPAPTTKSLQVDTTNGKAEPIHYEVFARVSSRDPLTHIGSVDAPNTHLAKARAWFVFDHMKWCEMFLVPTTTIVPVLNTNHQTLIKGA